MDDQTKEVIARAELPKLFRAIRVALGLSQQRMGKLSGISRVMISYYETADSVPTMTTFNKWLEAATKETKALRKYAIKDDKKYKYTRIGQGGDIPKTRKERDKHYRFLEATGIMRKIFSASEIILKEER